jgi:hypothetical protein
MKQSLRAKDIAAELAISRSSAYEVMQEMPRLVHRGKVSVARDAFEEWRAKHTVEPSAGATGLIRGGSRGRLMATRKVASAAAHTRPIVPRTKPRAAPVGKASR